MTGDKEVASDEWPVTNRNLIAGLERLPSSGLVAVLMDDVEGCRPISLLTTDTTDHLSLRER